MSAAGEAEARSARRCAMARGRREPVNLTQWAEEAET
jgi:hypothetical protein